MTDAGDVWLEDAVEAFVSEINGTVKGAVECDLDSDTPVGSRTGATGFVVAYGFAAMIRVEGAPTYRLEVTYKLAWNTAQDYPAVRESTYAVYLVESSEPLFHYDYQQQVHGMIPGAHLNVHHDRTDLRDALERSGRRNRGRRYRKRIDAGQSVSDSELHYPVGGSRFRPAIEDVIEFMIVELGVDATSAWRKTVEDGRLKWRERQLRAAIKDSPTVAADELRRLGFDVGGSSSREPNFKRLHEF